MNLNAHPKRVLKKTINFVVVTERVEFKYFYCGCQSTDCIYESESVAALSCAW